MLKKIMILSLTISLISCSNGKEVIKHSPGDRWEVNNSEYDDLEYDFSYDVEFISIDSEGFEIKLINNLSESENCNYNLVIAYIRGVDHIFANGEYMQSWSEGVFPISYYDIPEFVDEMIIYFPFNESQTYTKINATFDNLFWNPSDSEPPKCGIDIDLYDH